MQLLAKFQRLIRPVALLLALAWTHAAMAGPPLVTDDTGILDPGAWEVIVSATADKRTSADFYELPAGEVSYGLTEDSQMTVGFFRADLRVAGEENKSDHGHMSFGYKHRLLQGEKTSLVVAPGYSSPVNSSSSDRGLLADSRVLSLPVVAAWEVGPWVVTGQAAYDVISSGPNVWSYGLWTGYSATDSLQLLAEVYGVKVVGESKSETNWNLGIDYTLTEKWALLAAYGGGLKSDLANIDQLDTSVLIGFRYSTGP